MKSVHDNIHKSNHISPCKARGNGRWGPQSIGGTRKHEAAGRGAAAAADVSGCGPVPLAGRRVPSRPAIQTTSAVSEPACAILCKNFPSVECSGFIYGADDGTCRLFSGDCRGPTADSSQQTTDRYLGRNKCPGENNTNMRCLFVLIKDIDINNICTLVST